MTNYSERAKDLFKQGYNCSQAVIGAFCEDIGLDLETAMKISGPFGGGMGRMREVCGSLSAIFMVIGLKYGYSTTENPNAKGDLYKKVQEIAQQFKNQKGSIICKELLKGIEKSTSPIPSERTDEYYRKRPCIKMVEDAAILLENYIKEQELITSNK